MSTGTNSTETDVPMDTPDERIIHKLAQLRADSSRLNRLTSEHDVPFEVSAQLAFMPSDIDTAACEVAEHICGGDQLPGVCPVCDEPIYQPENGLEPGESYVPERLCVLEESSLGVRQSIIHYTDEPIDGGDETDE